MVRAEVALPMLHRCMLFWIFFKKIIHNSKVLVRSFDLILILLGARLLIEYHHLHFKIMISTAVHMASNRNLFGGGVQAHSGQAHGCDGCPYARSRALSPSNFQIKFRQAGPVRICQFVGPR